VYFHYKCETGENRLRYVKLEILGILLESTDFWPGKRLFRNIFPTKFVRINSTVETKFLKVHNS